MPNIEQFDSKGAPTPSEQGVEASVQAGRRIGLFAHQFGEEAGGVVKQLGEDYQKQVFRDEVSKGTVSLAQIQSKMLQGWNDQSTAAASSLQGLNDTQLAQKYLDSVVKPSLDAWTGQFQTPEGKMWAMEQAKDTYGRLWDKATAGQAELTGASAIANYKATAQGHAESAFHDYEHTADYAALMDADIASIVKSHPGLDDSHLAAMQESVIEQKRDIAATGVQGAIQADDTKYAREMLADPKMRGLLGDRVDELSKQADAHDRMMVEAKRADQAGQKEQAETHAKMVAAQAQNLLLPDADGNPPSAANRAQALKLIHDEATNNPLGASGIIGEFHSIGEVIKTQNEDIVNGTLTRDNPTAVADIARRIGDPNNPATLDQLNQLRINHEISQKSWEVYQTTIRDANDNPELKQAFENLNKYEDTVREEFLGKGGAGAGLPGLGATGGPDPRRVAAFAQFQIDNRNKLQAWIHSGESPLKAADILTNAANQSSVNRIIPWYLSRADAAPDAGGVTASFLLDPTPITKTQAAATRPGQAAAAVTAAQAGPTGAAGLKVGPGITQADIDFANAYHARKQ